MTGPLFSVQLVLAYLGPGGALSAIGSFLALVAAVALAVVGFLWLPLKRLLRSRKQKGEQPAAGSEAASGGVAEGGDPAR